MLRNREPPPGRAFPTTPDRSGVLIRDAVFSHFQPLSPAVFKTARKIGQPPLEPDDLPAISVYILGEDASSLGLPNMGPIEYKNDTTIGIAVARGFTDPVFLQGGLEQDVSFLRNLLLTDGVFTRRWYGALFESIPSYRVRWLYPSDGETWFGELRLEMTFRFPEFFGPTIVDRFEELDVKVDFINGDDDTGVSIETKYYLWQKQKGYGNGSDGSSCK